MNKENRPKLAVIKINRMNSDVNGFFPKQVFEEPPAKFAKTKPSENGSPSSPHDGELEATIKKKISECLSSCIVTDLTKTIDNIHEISATNQQLYDDLRKRQESIEKNTFNLYNSFKALQHDALNLRSTRTLLVPRAAEKNVTDTAASIQKKPVEDAIPELTSASDTTPAPPTENAPTVEPEITVLVDEVAAEEVVVDEVQQPPQTNPQANAASVGIFANQAIAINAKVPRPLLITKLMPKELVVRADQSISSCISKLKLSDVPVAPLPSIPQFLNYLRTRVIQPPVTMSAKAYELGIELRWTLDLSGVTNYEPALYYEIYQYNTEFLSFGDLSNPSVWSSMGQVDAFPLPMICKLNSCSRKVIYYFTVRSKDRFGRYSSWSNIVSFFFQ